jgi:hypothetical protein
MWLLHFSAQAIGSPMGHRSGHPFRVIYPSTSGDSHLKVNPTTPNVMVKTPSDRREINASGHVIHTGNQTINTATKTSKKISTHRLGRFSGLSL